MAYYYEKTAAALEAVDGQFRYIPGEHQSFEIKPGHIGEMVCDVPYDPSIHKPEDINLLSPWEDILEMPHVTLRKPPRPLGIDLVMHVGARGDHQAIVRAKQILGTRILDAIDDATDKSDRVNTYIIGRPDGDISTGGAEIIDEDMDPHTTARTVAELCTSGLAIVISDFVHLPLDEVKSMEAAAAVGIKVNFKLFEHELPEGLITLGKGREAAVLPADSKRRGRLSRLAASSPAGTPISDGLHRYQREITTRAERAGLHMAHVVFDPKLYKRYHASLVGFDEPTADVLIAEAITRATEE